MTPWIIPRAIDIAAIRECHWKGITLMPFVFIMDIEAVNKKHIKVMIPVHIIKGFPRMGK